MAVTDTWLGSALSGRSGVGKTFGTPVATATVAAGSVGADVDCVVAVGVIVSVAAGTGGTVAASDVFSAGIVTASGRGVLVSNAWATSKAVTSVGCKVGVADGSGVDDAVNVCEGVIVGVDEGVFVALGSGVGVNVLEAVAVAVGCGVLVVSVGKIAAAVET